MHIYLLLEVTRELLFTGKEWCVACSRLRLRFASATVGAIELTIHYGSGYLFELELVKWLVVWPQANIHSIDSNTT